MPIEGSDIVCSACARPVPGEGKPGCGLRIFCAARACRRCGLLGSCRLGPTSRQEERSCCKACRAQKRSPADSCIPKLHCHVLFLSLSASPSDTKRARPDAQPRPCTCSAQGLSVGARRSYSTLRVKPLLPASFAEPMTSAAAKAQTSATTPEMMRPTKPASMPAGLMKEGKPSGPEAPKE